jgi:hypothetical protein
MIRTALPEKKGGDHAMAALCVAPKMGDANRLPF